jgi:hypothetical protein
MVEGWRSCYQFAGVGVGDVDGCFVVEMWEGSDDGEGGLQR